MGPSGSTAAQRRLDGGMLGQVVDLAEGQNGDLYALDRDAAKVVVFDKSGSVRRIIGNGKGAGPGEFTRPLSMTLSEAGELFVLDPGQGRVSVFDTLGALRRTFPVAASLANQIRATRDRLYISQYVLKGKVPVILVYDHQGAPVDKVFTPSDEDALFGRIGNAYRMAVLPNGSLAVAHLNPGTWSLVGSPERALGQPLVADNVVENRSGAWTAPAALRGFGELSGGRGLVLYDLQKPGSTPNHPVVNIHLAIVAPSGGPVTTLDVGEVGRNLLVSRDGKSFYLTVAEPMYQVVRYRLGPQ